MNRESEVRKQCNATSQANERRKKERTQCNKRINKNDVFCGLVKFGGQEVKMALLCPN